MGSSFSILNNTDKPIWVSHGVCHAALWGSIGAVAAVVTAGAATAAAAAVSIPVAAGTIIVTESGVVMATTAAMALGLTSAQLAARGTASGLVAATA